MTGHTQSIQLIAVVAVVCVTANVVLWKGDMSQMPNGYASTKAKATEIGTGTEGRDHDPSSASTPSFQTATAPAPAPVPTSSPTYDDAHTLHAILQSNSSQYTWTGNHFMPPKDVPTFTQMDYFRYFHNRNTLFIGDSTARRSYATLYAMITFPTTETTTETVENVNINRRENPDIPISDLDGSHVIDVNRGRNRKEICDNQERILFNDTTIAYNYLCRDLGGKIATDTTTTNSSSSSSNSTEEEDRAQNTNTTEPVRTSNDVEDDESIIVGRKDMDKGIGKFDFFRANCLSSLTVFSNHTAAQDLFQDYDLIVISVGVHDAIGYCKGPINENVTTLDEKLEFVYGSIANFSSPSLQFALRTPGFMSDHKGDVVNWAIGHHIINKFSTSNRNENHGQSANSSTHNSDSDTPEMAPFSSTGTSNVTVVDWGTVISKRSYGKARIAGDIKAHYGLEARLLFAQQLLHELLAGEERKKITGEPRLIF